MADIEKKEMLCKECNSPLDQEHRLIVRTGCVSRAIAYPCSECGRIHWSDGKAAFNRAEMPTYYKDGVFEARENGVAVGRW